MKLSSLSILIPAYKDEQTIETVVTRARLAGKKYAKKFEIIVCDDASPDHLSRVLISLSKKIPELRVMRHTENKGYGGTMLDLYKAGKMQWLFSVPGDYQLDPMELAKFIRHTDSFDMIIGRRTNRNDTSFRKRQSLVYNGLLRLLFGIRLVDINSIRLFKRDIMKGRNITSTSAFVDAELTLGAIKDAYRVRETSIAHRKRETAGAGGGKLSIILPVIWDMIRYRLR